MATGGGKYISLTKPFTLGDLVDRFEIVPAQMTGTMR